jgi:cell division protein FtsX
VVPNTVTSSRARIGPVVALLLLCLVAACSKTVVPAPAPITHLTVYLANDATAAQRTAVESRVKTLPGAGVVAFVSHEEAYRRFKEIFKDRPDLVDVASPDNLPESYETVVTGTIDAATLAELKELPGVDQVTTPPQAQPTAPPPSR